MCTSCWRVAAPPPNLTDFTLGACKNRHREIKGRSQSDMSLKANTEAEDRSKRRGKPGPAAAVWNRHNKGPESPDQEPAGQQRRRRVLASHCRFSTRSGSRRLMQKCRSVEEWCRGSSRCAALASPPPPLCLSGRFPSFFTAALFLYPRPASLPRSPRPGFHFAHSSLSACPRLGSSKGLQRKTNCVHYMEMFPTVHYCSS